MKLLFLVHGMGSNPPGWSDGVRDKLDEVSGRYAEFKGNRARFSQRVKLCEIRYDGIFEEIVQQWQASADELASYATAQGKSLPKVVSWLKAPLPNDDAAIKGFFWSTAIDPLLYRAFALVRDRVRSDVMAQVVSYLTKNMVSGVVDASVLAHSLGTAVMHDTLHLLGKSAYNGNESFTAARWKFSNLFMIADVGVLGPTALRDIDAHKSVVRPTWPGSAAGKSYCGSFFNAYHRWDPFVLCGPFRPATWGAEYRELGPLEHIHQANVHSLSHYLDTPAVHVRIINHTLGFDAISLKEYQDAIAKYPQFESPECSAEIALLKTKIQEFDAINDDLEEIVIKAAEFFAVAKRAAESCKGLANEG